MATGLTTSTFASLPGFPTVFFETAEMERSKTSPRPLGSGFWKIRLARCLLISTTTAVRT